MGKGYTQCILSNGNDVLEANTPFVVENWGTQSPTKQFYLSLYGE